MTTKPQLAVLASGNGSNLQAIIDATNAGLIPATIRVVGSDKAQAFALERAKKADIETFVLSPKQFPTREDFDAALVKELTSRSVDWVILAGFMRILTPVFVRPFWKRIINIHPALLPKYPGIHSVQRAFEAHEKETGVTVHFVDEGVDTGSIILQETVPIHSDDTLETLTERVHEVEHRAYPEAIRRVLQGSG